MERKDIFYSEFDIAVIGMSVTFPQSSSVEEYWENIKSGRDCITRNDNIKKNDYVNSYGSIDGVYDFDADFFGISDYEALRMDPQHRKLMECVYKAIDNAGYSKRETDKFKTGLFCSSDDPYYVWEDYFRNGVYDKYESATVGIYSGSAVSSKISYKMNMTGPSILLRAACASSLVSIHMACQSLLGFECDMAIAAAVNISADQNGYYCTENTISPDGYTRAYDKNGGGFVPGNGMGAVVFKRLADAQRDNDVIYAVVKGSSIGNDGNRKIGYTAPSVEGEKDVIAQAIKISGIEPCDIGYIEGHGTATPLGDAIEIRALKDVLKKADNNKPYCALGSVKSNIGHLNISAGIAGFIKAVMCVKEGVIPPSINFNEPNTELNEEGCPVYIPVKLTKWDSNKVRIAGVSSFGIGGINAHVIIQEPPLQESCITENEIEILPYSADSIESLSKYNEKLTDYIVSPEINKTEASLVFKNVKPMHKFRDYIVTKGNDVIYGGDVKKASKSVETDMKSAKIAFLFPGGGSQSPYMGQELYKTSVQFRKYMDNCFNIIKEQENLDLKSRFCSNQPINEKSTLETLSLIFCVDYSLSMLMKEMGIEPDYLIGSSLGEYAATCVSGAIELHDALKMVCSRGKLFETISDGSMLTVSDSADNVKKYISNRENLSISAINSDTRTLVSGPDDAIKEFVDELKSKGIASVYLKAGKAGHCSLVEPILDDYEKSISDINYSHICTDLYSSYAGRKVSYNDISSALFWRGHMREPIRFYDVVKSLPESDSIIFIETGSGKQLSSFVRKIFGTQKDKIVIPLLGDDKISETENIYKALGELWRNMKTPNWSVIDNVDYENVKKVSVPEYVFDKKEYRHESKKIKNSDKYVIADGLSNEYFQRTKYIIENSSSDVIIVEKSGNRYKRNNFSEITDGIMKEVVSNKFNSPKVRLLKDIYGYEEAADKLMLSCILSYLKSRINLSTEKNYNVKELYSIFEIKENFIPFFDYLVYTLLRQEAAYIFSGKLFFTDKIYNVGSPEEQLDKFDTEFSEFKLLANLCVDVCKKYDDVFTGKKLASDIIYPGGSYDMLNNVYSSLPLTTYRYECINVIGEVLKKLKEKTKGVIRILEIGAGTGEMTETVLANIGDSNIEYWFTDVGTSFISIYGKSEKFKKYKNIKYHVFDITENAEKQGIPESYFDIVIGFDVVQATSSLKNSFSNIRKLLKDGGMTCCIQTYRENLLSNLIYGMSPGWWDFTKDIDRQNSITTSPEGWRNAISSAGFVNVCNYPENTDISDSAIFIGYKQCGEEMIFSDVQKEKRYNELLHIKNDIKLEFLDYDLTSGLEEELRKSGYDILEYTFIYQNETTQNREDENIEDSIQVDDVTNRVIKLIGDISNNKITDVDMPFEEMGIDSLSSLIIISRLKTMFNIKIKVEELYDYNSINKLVDYIKSQVSDVSSHTLNDKTITKHKKATKKLDDLFGGI
jgi:acyl transferase domain-containing protein/acyl carrier protein/ubiquinone/menaquinone biosynthesis C-methylase UbiE